jgi:DNA-binding CsgD family transcriptional regulator
MLNDTHESFLECLLPAFYQSAEASDNWCFALDQIKAEMQVGSVVVQKMRLDGNRLRQQWTVRDSASTEQAESHDCLVNNDDNPRFNLDNVKAPLADCDVYRGDDYDTLRQPEFRALEQRLQMIGLGRPIILGVKYSEDSSLCMVLHRHIDDSRPFQDCHAQFLRRLSPHLKQTVALAEKVGQLEAQTETLSHCIDHFSTGMLVLDHQARVCWVNLRAQQVLQGSRHLSISGSRLRCGASEDQAKLNEIIDSAITCKQAGQRFVGAVGACWDNPVQLLAVPVFTSSTPYIAIYLTGQDSQAELSASEVVKLFGLTPAEARLAIGLCDGESVNDYAARQGISTGTARIQLKSTFSKLGVNRQPDLVRLIGSSVATRTLLNIK